ncbi:MAG: hypothetical protein ACYS9T_11775 [Planctomycetota bacterium]
MKNGEVPIEGLLVALTTMLSFPSGASASERNFALGIDGAT